ncbi:MAG: sugar transferase [Holosporales bacterium]|jgi:O-antigen biosynthesis protein WbqP|nr:sugar transferase [Holosporales bacterium]
MSFVKRLFDIAFSSVGLILISPFMLLIAILIFMTTLESPIYWSKRVGRNNTLFDMPKFRSMHTHTPQVATHLMTDPDHYVTKIGHFLRRTSLDELPQFWSVLKGDMSFVGPRPALYNQDDLVSLRTKSGIHKLVPGITGWAQINGRDDLSIPEKVRLEKEYLQKRSFSFDVRILAITFTSAIRGCGIRH